MENNENTENISVIKIMLSPLSLMIILPILLILLLKNTQQSPPKYISKYFLIIGFSRSLIMGILLN